MRRGLILLALLPAVAYAAPPLELIAPRADRALSGGDRQRLAWRATGELEFEEWEAFLSLDDGQSYPIRLTPHLDRSVFETSVDLPNVDCSAARIKLRVGDERQEREILIPGRFRIARRPEAIEPRVDPAPGAAEPEVRLWVDGDRAGHQRRALALARSSSWAPEPTRISAGAESQAAGASRRSEPPPPRTEKLPRPPIEPVPASDEPPSGSGTERLTRLSRLNI